MTKKNRNFEEIYTWLHDMYIGFNACGNIAIKKRGSNKLVMIREGTTLQKERTLINWRVVFVICGEDFDDIITLYSENENLKLQDFKDKFFNSYEIIECIPYNKVESKHE